MRLADCKPGRIVRYRWGDGEKCRIVSIVDGRVRVKFLEGKREHLSAYPADRLMSASALVWGFYELKKYRTVKCKVVRIDPIDEKTAVVNFSVYKKMSTKELKELIKCGPFFYDEKTSKRVFKNARNRRRS